jgi:hypothetical protein
MPPHLIDRYIRWGWIAGAFVGTGTLAFVIYGALSGQSVLGVDAWNLLDVATAYALAYGIWRRSRVAAALMIAYMLYSKAVQAEQFGVWRALPTTLLFGYIYIQALRATIASHRQLNSALPPSASGAA